MTINDLVFYVWYDGHQSRPVLQIVRWRPMIVCCRYGGWWSHTWTTITTNKWERRLWCHQRRPTTAASRRPRNASEPSMIAINSRLSVWIRRLSYGNNMLSSQTGTSSKRAKISLEIYNTSSYSLRIYRNGVSLRVIIYTNVRSYVGQLGW